MKWQLLNVNWFLTVVYFMQLLHAARTQKPFKIIAQRITALLLTLHFDEPGSNLSSDHDLKNCFSKYNNGIISKLNTKVSFVIWNHFFNKCLKKQETWITTSLKDITISWAKISYMSYFLLCSWKWISQSCIKRLPLQIINHLVILFECQYHLPYQVNHNIYRQSLVKTIYFI